MIFTYVYFLRNICANLKISLIFHCLFLQSVCHHKKMKKKNKPFFFYVKANSLVADVDLRINNKTVKKYKRKTKVPEEKCCAWSITYALKKE